MQAVLLFWTVPRRADFENSKSLAPRWSLVFFSSSDICVRTNLTTTRALSSCFG